MLCIAHVLICVACELLTCSRHRIAGLLLVARFRAGELPSCFVVLGPDTQAVYLGVQAGVQAEPEAGRLGACCGVFGIAVILQISP